MLFNRIIICLCFDIYLQPKKKHSTDLSCILLCHLISFNRLRVFVCMTQDVLHESYSGSKKER